MLAAVAALKEPSAEAAGRRAGLRTAMDATLIGFGGGSGVEMNQRYTSLAIVADGSPEPEFRQDPVWHYQSSSRPGAHLPHAWLTSGAERISTLDLCGKGRFTLLTGLAGSAWAQAAAQTSHDLGIDIQVRIIGPGQPWVDSWGDFAAVSEIDEAGALLIRPDMFVAWRAPDCTDAARARLTGVMRSILALAD